ISGLIGDKKWRQTIDLGNARPGQGIAKAWARRRIREVKTERILGHIDSATARQDITRLGLNFGLVTDHTSLVAVDETASRPDDAPLTEEQLPINLPAGWNFNSLFVPQKRHGA